MKSMRPVLLVLLAACLTACGKTAANAAPKVDTAGMTIDGQAAIALGFGAEGGEDPAILHRKSGGWAVVYAGTRSGDRHLYLATSTDGKKFGPAKAVVSGAYSDQSPALVEDAAGSLHLFFASNRSGEDFQLFEATESKTGFDAPVVIDGFDGVQDLAVAQAADGATTVVAEVMGAGVLAATRKTTTFAAPVTVAAAGAEPAACALPDGRVLAAYQASGAIMTCTADAAGKFSTPVETATAADGSRLRDPGLAWVGNQGVLVYTEARGLQLAAFDADMNFGAAAAAAISGGDARGAIVAPDDNGSYALAWGMKTQSGQTGVLVSLSRRINP